MTPTQEDFELVDEYADIDYFYEQKEEQTKGNKVKHIIIGSFIGLAVLLIFSFVIGIIEMKSYDTNRVITQSYIDESKTYNACNDYVTYIVNEVYRPATTKQVVSPNKWKEAQKELVLKATEVNKKIENINNYIGETDTIKTQYYIFFKAFWNITAYKTVKDVDTDGKFTGDVHQEEMDFSNEEISTPSMLLKIFEKNFSELTVESKKNLESSSFKEVLDNYSVIAKAYNETLR